jgi:hypothetical protein
MAQSHLASQTARMKVEVRPNMKSKPLCKPDAGCSLAYVFNYVFFALFNLLHVQGKIGYFVKWKGYGQEDNSWVNEDDAGYASIPAGRRAY